MATLTKTIPTLAAVPTVVYRDRGQALIVTEKNKSVEEILKRHDEPWDVSSVS